MSWELIWTRPALQDMRRLDHQTAERIRRGVLRLSEADEGDVRRLQGKTPAEWALRVGDWRVRFAYDFQARTIRVLRVLPRGRAYRD